MPTLPLNSQEYSISKPKSFIRIIPFWIIFLLLPIVYFSKFYVLKDFNIASHSNIYNTTKFWFLVVSNIIILIIAADFGAFRSSINDDLYPKDNYYQYQPENDQTRSNSRLKINTPKIVESVFEEVKDIVVYKRTDFGIEPIPNFREDNNVVHHNDSKNDQEKKKKLPCRRLSRLRMSDEVVAIKDHSEKKMDVLYRSKTDKFDANTEDNEFSSMSNEELNKRVEEFIKRCNRQIRLEAVARRFQEV